MYNKVDTILLAINANITAVLVIRFKFARFFFADSYDTSPDTVIDMPEDMVIMISE